MNKNPLLFAGIWTFGGYVISQLIRLGGNLVLTRLLAPEMFGVMSIVTAINVGAYLFTEMGLRQNIIRHKQGNESNYLNTAWTMQIIRGLLISLIIAGIAVLLEWSFWKPAADNAYAYPQLPLIIALSGINAFISGFESTKIWLAQRELQLARQTLLELSSQTLAMAIMIAWAFYEKSIWGLVIGNLIGTLFKTGFSHIFFKGSNNKIFLDWKIAREFFQYGKWLFVSAVITFFAQNGDKIIFGGLLPASTLGVYSVALALVEATTTVFRRITDSVFVPRLSQIWRDNNQSLKETYYKLRMIQDPLVLTIGGLIYSTAPLIINFFYDNRYTEAASMLQILSLSLIGTNYLIGSRLIDIMGHTFIRVITTSTKALAIFILTPFVFHYYGIKGAIISIALNNIIEIFIVIIALSRYNMLNFFREFLFLPLFPLGYALGEGLNKFYSFIFALTKSNTNAICEIKNFFNNTYFVDNLSCLTQ